MGRNDESWKVVGYWGVRWRREDGINRCTKANSERQRRASSRSERLPAMVAEQRRRCSLNVEGGREGKGCVQSALQSSVKGGDEGRGVPLRTF